MPNLPLLPELFGCLVALLSAVAWALCSILFRKIEDKVSPQGTNLAKCLLGIFYLGFLFLFLGFQPVSVHNFLLLGVSGLLGIALGDTFFFKALLCLGPQLTLLLETLGPVFTVFLAVLILHETLSLSAWSGIFLTMAGIALVLWKDSARKEGRKNLLLGILYALISTLCSSFGVILAKMGVSSGSALQATFIRLLWGLVGLSLWGLIRFEIKNWLAPFREPRLLRLVLVSVFIAIFGGFWFSMAALKYTEASIATILSSTTPLFVLPLAAFILKKKISPVEAIGAAVAVLGVILILTSW